MERMALRKTDSRPTDMKIIKLQNIVVKLGKYTILQNINLDIYEGEIFGIVGMSGSGKTTLLNTLMGVLRPISGQVYYKPQQIIRTHEDNTQFKSVASDPVNIKHTFGFSAQIPSYYPKLTVKENMDFFGSMYGLPEEVKTTNIEILLDLVGLTKATNRLSENLSGGMQKRLDIACALIHNPHVLILDEPTADLDPVLRKQMWDLIRKINHRGTTVILASHFLEELDILCDRIAILFDREVAAIGNSLELRKQFKSGEVVRIQTESRDYSGIISMIKDEFKLLDTHFVDKYGKLEIRIPETETLIDELTQALEIKPKQAENMVVPTLSAPFLLQKIMRYLERQGEKPIYLSGSRADLDNIFEGIVTGKRSDQ